MDICTHFAAVHSGRGPVVLAVGARHPGALPVQTDREIWICTSTCIFVCVYMYIYSYVLTYILGGFDLKLFIDVYLCIYFYIRIHMCVCVHVCIYAFTVVRVCVCVCMHERPCVHMSVYVCP